MNKRPSNELSKKLKDPMVDFLEFFLHLHKLNYFLINSITRYEHLHEKMIEAKKLISRMTEKPEHQVDPKMEKQENEIKEAIRKEINDGYYTLKSSEIILIYSRLEAAITETVHLLFHDYEYKDLKEIENIKVNALNFMKLSKREQINYLSEQYIVCNTQSIKYGFNRFEAILKPLIGPSKLIKNHQDVLFKFAQVRNLLIHKNGIIDNNFKTVFKSNKYKVNSKIKIDQLMLNNFYDCTLAYSEDILDRLTIKMASGT